MEMSVMEQFKYDLTIMQTANGDLNRLISNLQILQGQLDDVAPKAESFWHGKSGRVFVELCRQMSKAVDQYLSDVKETQCTLKDAIQIYCLEEGKQVSQISELDADSIF